MASLYFNLCISIALYLGFLIAFLSFLFFFCQEGTLCHLQKLLKFTKYIRLFLCMCGIGVWAQGLHLEPLHQPFLQWNFWDSISQAIYPVWVWTEILLFSVSWVARVTGMSCWRLVNSSFLCSESAFSQWLC
jgi:hypothetical protein